MAFRRRRMSTRRFGRRAPSVRSTKNMNTGWVAKVEVAAFPTVLNLFWFTDVIFVPLVELADYADRESLDPDGVPSKQDRCKVLRMVGDINWQMVAGTGGSHASWTLAWYIAAFGAEEIDNAVGNSLAGGLVNYDPLGSDAQFLFRQQRILMHRQVTGQAHPTLTNGTDLVQAPDFPSRNFHLDKRMNLPLKTDEELYLVAAAAFGQTSEEEPQLGLSLLLRFLITD